MDLSRLLSTVCSALRLYLAMTMFEIEEGGGETDKIEAQNEETEEDWLDEGKRSSGEVYSRSRTRAVRFTRDLKSAERAISALQCQIHEQAAVMYWVS